MCVHHLNVDTYIHVHLMCTIHFDMIHMQIIFLSTSLCTHLSLYLPPLSPSLSPPPPPPPPPPPSPLSPDIPESVEVVEGVGEDVALLLDFDP